MARVQKLPPRFVNQVRKLPNGCWKWKGFRDRDGYGRYMDQGKSERAHLAAYRLRYGKRVTGVLRHQCDTPACVNPRHGKPGTQRQNVREMMKRGRDRVIGSRNPRAVLNDKQVRTVRKLSGQGITQGEIAKRVGASQPAVSRVVSGRGWSHVSTESRSTQDAEVRTRSAE